MKHTALILCSVLLLACNGNKTPASIEEKTPTTNEEIMNLIKEEFPGVDEEPWGERRIKAFTKFQFLQERGILINESKGQGYQISEVIESGNALKYFVEIPEGENKFEYSCIPDIGELTMVLTGEKETVNLFYKQNKVALNLENCSQEEDSEYCEKYQKMGSEPVQTRFINSIVNSKSGSVFFYKRVNTLL